MRPTCCWTRALKLNHLLSRRACWYCHGCIKRVAAGGTQGVDMLYTRREIGKLALAVPAAGFLAESGNLLAATKPNSKWAGVQVGMNVPYNFGPTPVLTPDEVLQKCIDLGISGVELRSQPVEAFLGVPANLAPPRGRGTRAPDPAIQKANAEELRKWRLGVPMSKVQEFRKKWSDAGVLIDIVKYDGIYNFTDD